jgi:hypothetical protein
MQSLTLAYRDDDRTPMIFAIREIAKRHYGLEVRIVRIQDWRCGISTGSRISTMAGLSTSWLNRCRVSPNPLIVIAAQAGIQEWRRGIRVAP